MIVRRAACPSANEAMANEGAANMALEQSAGANRPGTGWAHVTILAINGKDGWKCSKCGSQCHQFSALAVLG